MSDTPSTYAAIGKNAKVGHAWSLTVAFKSTCIYVIDTQMILLVQDWIHAASPSALTCDTTGVSSILARTPRSATGDAEPGLYGIFDYAKLYVRPRLTQGSSIASNAAPDRQRFRRAFWVASRRTIVSFMTSS